MRQKLKILILLFFSLLLMLICILPIMSTSVYAQNIPTTTYSLKNVSFSLCGAGMTHADDRIKRGLNSDNWFDSLDITVTQDGKISFEMINQKYLWDDDYSVGSDYYTDNCRVATLYDDSESWSSYGDSDTYHNYTSITSNFHNSIYIYYNNQTYGCYHNSTSTYYSNTINLNKRISQITFDLKVIIVDEDGYSYTNSESTYYFYELDYNNITIKVADTSSPEITGISNGEQTSSDVTLSFSDDFAMSKVEYSYSLSSYSSNYNYTCSTTSARFSNEGYYRVKAIDTSNNESIVQFLIDKTAPVISGVEDGSSYNTNKTISFSDSLTGIKEIRVNGNVITSSKYSATEEGSYSISAIDNVGNTNSLNFKIDKTAPSISIVGNDEATSSVYKTVKVNYSDNDIDVAKYSYSATSYETPTNSFSSGTSFTTEGYYSISVTDKAGNVTSKNFRIDKSSPVISGVEDGESYNSNKTLTFSDNYSIDLSRFYINGSKVELSNNTYSLKTSSYTGEITVKIYDLAGNYTEKKFTIDITNPNLTITNANLSSSIYYINDYVTISSSEYVTFGYNNQTSTGTSLTLYASNFENGKCVLAATDTAGNATSLTLYFDRSNPIINLTNVSEKDGTYYSKNSSNLSASSNYSPIASITLYNSLGTSILEVDKAVNTISTPGNNRIVVTNMAGNSSEVVLIIDKTAPTINISASGEELNNNSYTNSNIKISYSDDILLASSPCYVTFNGETTECDNNKTFSDEGLYVFTAYDYSGNVSEKKITIDKTLPVISGVEDGSYYNTNKRITVSDSSSGISKVIINGSQVELNNNSYTISNNDYSGKVIIDIYDTAGNILKTIIYMDNTAPTVNFENNKYYSYNIKINIEDLCLSDESELKLNGASIYTFSNSYKTYTTSADGRYDLYLKDKAGNESTFSFYIDTIYPEAIITGYTSHNSNSYKANSSSMINVSWNDEASVTFNGSVYNSNFNINGSTLQDGEYDISITDLAGNTTIYILDIKSSIPVATFAGYFQYLNGAYYLNNSTVLEVSWTDTQATAIIDNNEEYRNNFSIDPNQREEGTYNIILKDDYDNSSTYTIIIDKSKDYKNYNFLLKQNYSWINHWYNTYNYLYNNQSFSISDYNSFKTYEEAEAYARIRELSTYEKITYSGQTIFASELYGNISEYYDYENLSSVAIGDDVYIYKSPTNSSKILVYFSYSNFKQTMDSYISNSISEYYRYFDNANNIKEAYNDSLYYDVFYINENEYTLSKAESTTIIYTSTNGITYQKQTNKATLSLGTNYIKEVDIAGNVTIYVVVINTTPLNYIVFGNSQYTKELNNTNTLYASEPVTLQLNGNYPEHNIIKVSYKDLNNNLESYYIIDDGLVLNDEGTYVIDTYDVCGNKSSTYTIYILYSEENKPKITYNINKLDGIVIDINFTIEYYQIVNSQIKNILVKFTAEDGTSSYITVDGNGNTITTATKTLTFVESGTYEISITDIFGNEATVQETLQKGNPFGQIMAGNPGNAIPSGTVTNQNIYFEFNSEYEYTCLLNGSVYVSGTGISKEGYYEFVLSNADKTATYIVTIDKTAPAGQLVVDGIEFQNNKTTSSTNVKFTYDEADATATLNGLKIKSGSFITEEKTNIIYLTDEAGNISEYKITLDYTAPNVKIYAGSYEVENGSIVNSKIKFEWSESNCKAYVNGALYTSGKWYTLANTYTLIIEDQYGNSKEYTVTIDLSNPEFVIYDVGNNIISNGSKINSGFYISWEDDSYIAYVNSNPYAKNTVISQAKEYVIQIINIAGTIVESNISISYDKPSGTLFNYSNQILQTDSIINTRFYFSYSDTKQNRYTCYVNDSLYQNGQIIKQDGTYEFKLIDSYGNYSLYSIIKDSVAPEGLLHGVTAGAITNNNVSFTFDEAEANSTLDGVLYFSGTEIEEEGTHVIEIYDLVGNTNVYTFTIDKTAPTFIYSSEPNINGYINQKTSITWSESNCTALLNNRTYISGNRIYDGEYEFILTDQAGNSSISTFIVDTSSPTLNINGIDKNGNSNQNVLINWNGEYTVYLNEIIISNNYIVESDGKYTVLVYNLSGNSNEYEFEISRIAPVGTLVGVNDNGITKSSVSFIYSDGTATLNGTSYSSGTTINREGNYHIVLTNKFNNSSEYNFTIDKTAPIITLNGVKEGKSTRDDVYASFEEDNLIIKLNNNFYVPFDVITEEGLYTLTAEDLAGNITTVTFTIDKTAPIPVFEGVEPGKATNTNVYISWNESATAYLNGKSYSSGSLISKEGEYEFVIQDNLGNTASYYFVIDKTAPNYTIFDSNQNELKPNSSTSIEFYVLCEEENSMILLNQEIYLSAVLSEEGTYDFEVKDSLGNSAFFRMTIDHTLPEATFEGVIPYGKTKDNVVITFSRGITATLNDEEYESGTKIKLEGFYTLVLTNEINNTNIYTFTIDKTAPVAVFEGLNEYNYSNNMVIATFDESDAIARLNGNPYYSGIQLKEENVYSLELTDIVGNINVYTFTIDKTAPEGELVGVDNNGFTNKSVSFKWDDNATAVLNDKIYNKGSSIKEEGSYSITLTDLAGNVSYYSFEISTKKPTCIISGINQYNLSNTSVKISYSGCIVNVNDIRYTNQEFTTEGTYNVTIIDKYGNTNQYEFIIDHTLPLYEINGVEPDGFTNKAVYITWSESDCSAYLNNEKYYKGSSIKEDGIYEFKLIDIAGNTNICNFAISTVLPEATFDGLNEYNYSNGRVVISFNSELTATLNDVYISTLTEITDEGEYTLYLVDKYNNARSYEFVIDKTAPVYEITGIYNDCYTNKNVRITWTEAKCKAYLNDEEYASGTTIRADGIYEFKLEDLAGNVTTYHFEKINTVPKLSLNATFYKKTNTCEDVSCTWEDDSYVVLLDSNNYNKGDLITEEGIYILSVTDKYGNYREYDFTIDKTLPDCSISGTDNNGFTNKRTKIVSQEYDIDIVVNGELIDRDYITTQNNPLYNGIYNVKVYDAAGNYIEYNFEYFYKELQEDLLVNKNEDETSIILTCEKSCVMSVDGKVVESGYVLDEAGSHNVIITDKYGNSYEQKLTVKAVATPNYIFANIATIASISLISLLIIFIFVKKIRANSKNPYKRK